MHHVEANTGASKREFNTRMFRPFLSSLQTASCWLMFKAEAELMSASQRLQALKPTEMVSEYSEQDGFFSAGGDGLTWRLESEKP